MVAKHHTTGRPRRGMILIIVVAFLALGLSVGIAFVFYAHQQATGMRMYREAGQGGRAAGVNQGSSGLTDESPPQPTDLFNMAMGQLIYGNTDPILPPGPNQPGSGQYSGMYGHDLARSMYGWNTTPNAPPNNAPWDGFGRIHNPSAVVPGQDEYNLINYTSFGPAGPWRIAEQESGTYIAKNAPYTYPDENNVYLAAIRATDGKVMVPSFHRPWLFGDMTPLPPFGNGNPVTSMWSSVNHPEGKYLTIRPRPEDHRWPPGPTGTIEFPYPQQNADGSWGDVENLEGKEILAAGNTPTRQLDSFWIDLDAPVRKWRGRFYKPLFAFLVSDVDGRINVNVAGNRKEQGGTQASLQGWGGWEMGLSPALSDIGFARNIIFGGNPALRRFSNNDQQPTNIYSLDGGPAQTAPPGVGAPFYSNVDFDGSTVTDPGPAQRMTLPNGYMTSPTWPNRYKNGGGIAPGERYGHPLVYNPYLAVRTKDPQPSWAHDHVLGPVELYYLNSKINGDPTNYSQSDLAKLYQPMINSVFLPNPNNPNPRYLTTTYSNDLQRTGMRPWRTPTGAPYMQLPPAPPYTQPAPFGLPSGGPINSPPPGPAPANSDFDTNWTSKVASQIGVLDLNRKLTDYRGDASKAFEAIVGGQVNGTINFGRAQQERQQFAQDIFVRLLAATGAVDPQLLTTWPINFTAIAAPGTPPFDALRRLAQIAVNMVDYLDSDDYITPFNWNPIGNADITQPPQLQNGWVFGTELPRLVVNEVYTMWENDAQDPVPANGNQPAYAAQPYHFNIYAELHNPLTPPGGPANPANGQDPTMSNNGAALLAFQSPNGPINPYRLVITKQPNATLNDANNADGHWDRPPQMPNAQVVIVDVLGDVNTQGGVVPASNGQLGQYGQKWNGIYPANGPTNPSFYVVGPKNQSNVKNNNAPATIPGSSNFAVSYECPKMSWAIQLTDPVPQPPTLFLQRLLCPHRPYDAIINPYITVDYVETVQPQIFDHRQYLPLGQGQNSQNPAFQPFSQHHSYGRNQPYAGAAAFYLSQNMNPPNQPPQGDTNPITTFFQHNNPLQQPFDWLVHLDRSLVSVPEIMCVSAWKPHELAHHFILGTPQQPPPRLVQQHLANWKMDSTQPNAQQQSLVDSQRLYRAFSLFDVRNRTYGMGFGGRLPGKMNINTIWHSQIFESMANPRVTNDPLRGNQFDTNQVQQIWPNKLLPPRNMIAGGNTASVWTTAPLTALTDKPFMPAGENFTPPNDQQLSNDGVQNTILNGVLDVPGQTHPYLQSELLTKIFNNITTRSNTFNVWCTVGYFEVRNPGPYDSTNRPILGKELGSDDGTNIRHKLFAVVDRTNLSVDPTSTATRRLQGPRPIFLSYEPTVPNASPQNPIPLTLPDPITVKNGNNPPQAFNVRIPATFNTTVRVGNAPVPAVGGYYDGQMWALVAGQSLLVDIGPRQEMVTVTAVQFLGAGTGADIKLQFPGNVQHARGCIMQFDPQPPQPLNRPPSTLGNPGPQPSFNYKDPRYAPVVPVFVQVN